MVNNREGKTVAALDVGSNSVRLLVAEQRGGLFLPIFRDRITSRLFSGLKGELLHPDAIFRTIAAIEQLTREAREHGAHPIWAFGTSAMRDGRNSGELIQAAAALGVELQVLSGDQEALISYEGAAPRGCAGVIDIGGGSTELLAGGQGRVLRSASAQVGAVRLCESMLGAPAPGRMIQAAQEALRPAYKAVRDVEVDRWVGLGGTITTLAAMQLELVTYDADQIEAQPISGVSAQSWLEQLCAMPLSARKQIKGMNPARADIMPFGLAILCAFFELSGVDRVFASDLDNLLGYLMKKAAEGLDKPPEMR